MHRGYRRLTFKEFGEFCGIIEQNTTKDKNCGSCSFNFLIGGSALIDHFDGTQDQTLLAIIQSVICH